MAAAAAASRMGLDATELDTVLDGGTARLALGLDGPDSPAGRRAALLLRLYAALHAQAGSEAAMWRWLHTASRHTGGVPAGQIQALDGLQCILGYLDRLACR